MTQKRGWVFLLAFCKLEHSGLCPEPRDLSRGGFPSGLSSSKPALIIPPGPLIFYQLDCHISSAYMTKPPVYASFLLGCLASYQGGGNKWGPENQRPHLLDEIIVMNSQSFIPILYINQQIVQALIFHCNNSLFQCWMAIRIHHTKCPWHNCALCQGPQLLETDSGRGLLFRLRRRSEPVFP